MIRLSLVVPVYGVEKYINKFLNSLEKNLCDGIEVLLINDGSKDCSGIIAREFSELHPDLVKVINKENGGVSSARNYGIELSKGQYIIFPDPDDFLDEKYVDTILTMIVQYDLPDMIFFDYYVGNDLNSFSRHTVSKLKQGIVSKEIFIREHIKDTDIKGMVWNKAIKKEIYDGLKFNTNTRFGEDYEVMTEIAMKIDKVVYVRKPLYYYVMHDSSLTHTATLEDIQRFFDLVLDRQEKHSKLYKDLSQCKVVKVALDVLGKAYLEGFWRDIAKYENIIKKNISRILFSSDFNLKEKMKCLLVCFGLAKSCYDIKYKIYK